MYGYFDDTVIYLTQGNHIELDIEVRDEETGEAIELQNDDYILLTVENKNHKTVFQKKLTIFDVAPGSKAVTCVISAQDTVSLPTGEYPFDCLYVTGGTNATTFIRSSIVIQKAIGKYTDGAEGGVTS